MYSKRIRQDLGSGAQCRLWFPNEPTSQKKKRCHDKENDGGDNHSPKDESFATCVHLRMIEDAEQKINRPFIIGLAFIPYRYLFCYNLINMFKYIIRKLFGTRNDRVLKKMASVVAEINTHEETVQAMTDEELKAKTPYFRNLLQTGKTLDDILPEVFAVVRETARRVLGMRHYDVQLLGGIVLHRGMISEMKTGEGKTLVATLPAYLNALTGKGVHIVTVNDYLANRDANWMGEIFRFLGLSVGVIQHEMSDEERRDAYRCDITYGTNNEFGFDYLRDNMKFEQSALAQRPFYYAIVDEVDSILIDEARTPLIISGPTEGSTAFFYNVNDFVKRIKNDSTSYELDEKSKTVVLTETGIAEAERFFKIDNLYDLSNMELLHQIYQSLKAHKLFARDVDYLVKDNQVVIVDEFTGRMMPGRRYSDGLHQALEAKENVRIEREYQTLATITFQNLFRMYEKLSGMTGTAITEAVEFSAIYNLDVIEIPTNRPLIRIEHPDVIYGSLEEKWNAVVEEIRHLHEKGQPVLVGTISIENSELLSKYLKREKIPHVVLNAKYHEREAEIVAQAGRLGAVTIATNMAGRGTDILLGGNPDFILREELKKKGYTLQTAPEVVVNQLKIDIETSCREAQKKVLTLGGLHILGTERHESRRIDNQLRGRSGRQGDPGSSRFYISLEDNLMKILGSDRIKNLLVRSGMRDGVPIENKLVSRAIENAQKQIEGQHFSIRKHLLEYDDVMNKQRQVIYTMRHEILMGADLSDQIQSMVEGTSADLCESYLPGNAESTEWQVDSFKNELKAIFGIDIQSILDNPVESYKPSQVQESIMKYLKSVYREKEQMMGTGMMREFERWIFLQIIDNQWKDHLLTIDHLKEGIGLRSYAQRDPLIEYKKESFTLFEELQQRIDEETLRFIYQLKPVVQDQLEKQKSRQKSTVNRPTLKMPGRKAKKRR